MSRPNLYFKTKTSGELPSAVDIGQPRNYAKMKCKLYKFIIIPRSEKMENPRESNAGSD